MMTTTTTTFFTISSSSSLLHFNRSHNLLSYPPPPRLFSFTPLPHIKKRAWGQRLAVVKVNCVSEQRSKQTTDDDTVPSPSPLESSSPTSEFVDGDEETGNSAYKWCAALGGIGFVETAYLTYLKLTDSDAFCPTGGASCTTILTSDYSSVFGFPLPLFGMLSYGLVAALGLQLGAKKSKFETGKTDSEIILIGTTTSMAAASAYFLYILSTEFSGEFCLYCLASAVLSFSLFFITSKSFGSHELQKILGLQLSVASLVVIALTASYNAAQPISPSMSETEIPYFETKITKKSSPFALSLARHLRSVGAKLYGAFWCTHCQDQKEMFGREAAKLLDYVECFPDGVKPGTQMAKACVDVKLQGFPTWVINGEVLSGEKQLPELAKLSGMEQEDSSQSN